MPWKNGAGTTIEIAVFPKEATLDNFIWRVSRAQVVSDGEFSCFDDMDRSLALLNGVGMRLISDGVVQQVDKKNNIVTFSGSAKTHAELISGPINDFNLMSRHSVCSHQLMRWADQQTQKLPANTVLLYCAHGTGKLLAKKQVIDLCEDESVHFSSQHEAQETILHCDPNSCFYCIQIQMNRE